MYPRWNPRFDCHRMSEKRQDDGACPFIVFAHTVPDIVKEKHSPRTTFTYQRAMNAIWKETVGIRACDVDFNNRIKVSSIFNHMQDVASIHADALELGFKHLSEVDLFWVLAWAKIEIEAYPTFGNTLTIKTWPKFRHKLYSVRDFIISDEAN